MTSAPERPDRLERWFPGVAAARGYQRSWARPDVAAGLTVGAMLVPQSMAYAELAGLPPQYGFYAVIGALVVYALVGTSRHLGVGPEPGTAILAATGVASLAGGDPDRYIALMAALALVVAAICIAGAVARLGFLASALSKPVLVGYITGVGLTLLSSQLAAFTGVRIDADSFFPRLAQLVTRLDDLHGPTFATAAATLALVLALRRRVPAVPGPLVGVVLATVIVAVASLDRHGIALVGRVPSGLPSPRWPDVSWGDVGALVPIAAGIALVGYSDNVLTARSLATRLGYRIDANRELLALGLTNLSAGLSQGFPVSSSASRTAVPASLGSRTQLVSIIAAAFVVATLLVLHPLLGHIPRPALAAVIVSAALAIIDVAGYRALWKVRRSEAGLAVVAAFGVVAFDVLVGVVVAVTLSLLVALYGIARPHDAVLGDSPGLDGWVEVHAHPGATTEPGLVVYRFDAPLFFVNAEHFRDRIVQVLDDNPGQEEWLVVDCEGIGDIDTSALDVLVELVETVSARGANVVAVTRANDRVLDVLRRGDLLEPTGRLRSFPTINSAVRAYRERNATSPADEG